MAYILWIPKYHLKITSSGQKEQGKSSTAHLLSLDTGFFPKPSRKTSFDGDGNSKNVTCSRSVRACQEKGEENSDSYWNSSIAWTSLSFLHQTKLTTWPQVNLCTQSSENETPGDLSPTKRLLLWRCRRANIGPADSGLVGEKRFHTSNLSKLFLLACFSLAPVVLDPCTMVSVSFRRLARSRHFINGIFVTSK